MMGTMMSPASGSAHHNPSRAFRSKPTTKMADRYAQNSVCVTKERLFDWHAHLFPEVRRTTDKFRVGTWRDDSQGVMQMISTVRLSIRIKLRTVPL